MQFAWGQGIPAQGMQPLNDLIQPINNNNPNVEFSYKDEQMLLETKVQELLGQPDYTLQSMINRRQPRTLGEVQMQTQGMQSMFALDSDLIRLAFEELFNWIWELWCQYGEDQYEFAYFGQNGWEPIRLTKEEVQGKYKITVRGNDQNTNPQVRTQKAELILQMAENPALLQTGVITPMNLANIAKRVLQYLNVDNWEEFISAPQPPPPPTVQQTAPLFKPKFKDLTAREQAQIVASLGVQPDVEGRGNNAAMDSAKKRMELTDMHADIKNKEGEDMMNMVDMMTSLQEPKPPIGG
jgi:hypothetical protein